MLKVNNITVTALFSFKSDFKLNLQELAQKSYFIEYNPHFIGAITRNPSGTCLVFSNRKVNCVGCKKLSDAKLTLKRCANRIFNAFSLLYVPDITRFRLFNKRLFKLKKLLGKLFIVLS